MLGNAWRTATVSKADGKELGQGEERWSRDKLSGKEATTQFIAVSCFASTPPLKPSLVLISLTWEVQFTLENFLLLLPRLHHHQLQQSCLQEP